MTKPFVNLHTHSHYSILEAVQGPGQIVNKAKDLGCPAVALTDSGVGYGLIEFYQAANKAEIKPILGAEIFVAKDSRFERRAGIDGREGSVVLLAKDDTGYQHLLKIISHAQLEGFYYKPRADWELLEKYAEGLIVLTGASGGLVGKCFRDMGEIKAEKIFDRLQKIYGTKNVFIELTARTFEEQVNLNKFNLKLSEKFSAPLVATSDARYTQAEDEEAADTLHCIGKNQQVSDPNRLKMAEKNWFKSWEEIEADLSYVPEDILEQARENTLSIAEQIDLTIEFGQNLLPQFEVEPGLTEADQLRKNCEAGMRFRFPLFFTESERSNDLSGFEILDYEPEDEEWRKFAHQYLYKELDGEPWHDVEEVEVKTDDYILGVKKDDKLVGIIGYTKREIAYYIETLAVHPEYRGQGVGEILINEIERRAATKNYKFLRTDSLLPEYFEKMGFMRTDDKPYQWENKKNGKKYKTPYLQKSVSLESIITLEKVQERLDYELGIISRMGFDAYFLIVQDFIQFAKNNGIAVGPGRGSAAGSLVSYLLEITNIDPLKYELLFERFLNPERVSMPDIDIDFSDERRDEVLQYVIEKYGAEKVSKVCTFGTLAAKAALKDVGRAQGVPFAQMNAMTKILPNKTGFTLDDAEKNQDFKTLIGSDENLKKVFEVAKKLEGCVRHVSVHACAVIIGKDDLSQTTPIQWAPGAEEAKITQFPYQQLEKLGLLKMDFLGLRNLSILEKAVQNVELSTGQKINLDEIPVDDTKTFEMFARGETTGVFQFESAGMRRYLKELKPTEFEDLVAMNALYRPGPMEYIPVYIEGKHKPETVKYEHEVLEPILKKTYGIAVYQEQVLRIAQDFAGFSLGEADILRKAIGKKIMSILSQQRKKFIEGAVAKGFKEKLAIKIFDEIVVPFSGYGFNRSHAVCYARIAYETAYLRANYPVEFMAAMMTTDRNNTDRIVLEMNECASMDIEVLPPSINDSGSYFTIISEKKDDQQMEMGE